MCTQCELEKITDAFTDSISGIVNKMMAVSPEVVEKMMSSGMMS